jgi:hypothetical protein
VPEALQVPVPHRLKGVHKVTWALNTYMNSGITTFGISSVEFSCYYKSCFFFNLFIIWQCTWRTLVRRFQDPPRKVKTHI